MENVGPHPVLLSRYCDLLGVCLPGACLHGTCLLWYWITVYTYLLWLIINLKVILYIRIAFYWLTDVNRVSGLKIFCSNILTSVFPLMPSIFFLMKCLLWCALRFPSIYPICLSCTAQFFLFFSACLHSASTSVIQIFACWRNGNSGISKSGLCVYIFDV